MADRRLIARLRRGASALALGLSLAGGLGGCVAVPEGTAAGGAPAAASASLAVAAPLWRAGDRWTYSDGYGLEVEAVEGGLTRFRRLDDRDQWVSRRGFLRQDAQSATTERSVVFRSIGADEARRLVQGEPILFTREFLSGGVTRVHSTSWLLEGRERVSVPAGDFDAYVVVMRTRNPETGWTGFERWWYAPEVRHYVRLEYRYGDQPVGSRVLVDYAAPDAVAKAVQNSPPRAHQAVANDAASGAATKIAPPSASQGPNGNSSDAASSILGSGGLFGARFDKSAPTP